MPVQLFVNKPKRNRKKVIRDTLLSCVTTLASTGTMIVTSYLSKTKTIPVIVLGYIAFCTERIKSILDDQKIRKLNRDQLDTLNKIINDLNTKGGAFLIEGTYNNNQVTMTKDNMSLIYQPFSDNDPNLINYDDSTPNIMRVLVKVRDNNPITIATADNSKFRVDANNNLKIKSHFGSSLLEPKHFGCTLASLLLITAALILSIITISMLEGNNTFNFSNQAGDASFYTGTIAFVLAVIATILAPTETYIKRKNLYAAGAFPDRSSVNVNHLLMTHGFVANSRFGQIDFVNLPSLEETRSVANTIQQNSVIVPSMPKNTTVNPVLKM